MSNEPEKNIEQRLQDYAKRRREAAGAPLELHPVTRNLLQDEVARTLAPAAAGEAPAEKQANWLARLWPRIAFGGALFASLVFVVFAVVKDSQMKKQAMAMAPERTALFMDAGAREEKQAKVADRDADKALSLGTMTTDEARRDLARTVQATPAAAAPSVVAQDRLVTAGDKSTSLAFNEGSKAGVALDKEKALAVNDPAAGGGPRPADAPVRQLAEAVREKEQLTKAAREFDAMARERTEAARVAGEHAASTARFEMAKNEVAAAAPAGVISKDANRAPAPPPPAPMPALSAKPQPGTAMTRAKVPAEAPVALQSELKAREEPARLAAMKPTANPAPAAPAPAKEPTDAKKGDAYFAYTAGAQQRFVLVDNNAGLRRNFNSPPFPKIMKSFQVETAGDKVRITDADGSVYEGQFVIAVNGKLKQANDGAAEAQNALRDVNGIANLSAAAPGVEFEASGFNQTLGQSVTFRGSFVTVNNSRGLISSGKDSAARKKSEAELRRIQPAVAGGAAAANNAFENVNQNLQQMQIRGRATVGGSNQYDLQAMPAR